ncbi:MAG TPA: MarR family winged helix-turn-helix transcriptional regulator [Aliidongia sp.]|nr:MarR family winged helix-turn-helix transcriptional regulator [Aliidongia sp.]
MKQISDTQAPVPDDRDLLDLERFLPYRLSVLSNRISTAIARVYEQRFGLSIPEWRLIAVLGRFGPLSANGVAERTYMDKVRVSRAVQRLLQRGLIERAMDGADRRRSILQLSAEGRTIRAEVAPLALDIERGLLTALSRTDRAELDRLLGLLDAGAGQLMPVDEASAKSS